MEHVVCKTFYKFLEIHQFVELRGHSWHRKSGNSCYRLLNHIPRWLLFHYKMRISTSVLCGFLSLLIPHQNFCLDYVDHDPHIPQVLKNTASNWEKKKMDKVFTIIIKAKLTLTQFLCNVIILSVPRLRPSHTHTCTHARTRLKAAGAFASQTPSWRLLLSAQGTQARRSRRPGPLSSSH